MPAGFRTVVLIVFFALGLARSSSAQTYRFDFTFTPKDGFTVSATGSLCATPTASAGLYQCTGGSITLSGATTGAFALLPAGFGNLQPNTLFVGGGVPTLECAFGTDNQIVWLRGSSGVHALAEIVGTLGMPTQNGRVAVSGPFSAPLGITSKSLPKAISGQAYSATLTAAGGTPPVKWSLEGGSTLPPSFTLNARTGVLASGGAPPVTPGIYTFTVVATDSANATALQPFNLTVLAATLKITTTSLPDTVTRSPYRTQLTATGSRGEKKWSVVTGAVLPPGFSLNEDGVLRSTGEPPAPPMTYTFRVQVTDAVGALEKATLKLKVTPLPRPKLTLLEATTLDGSSIIVTYTISVVSIKQNLHFDVYRSDARQKTANSIRLGGITFEPNNDPLGLLALGKRTVRVAARVALPPITGANGGPAMPFVVVVADTDGSAGLDAKSIRTVAFEKHQLGVVVHGFTFEEDEPSTLGWMNAMARGLTDACRFERADTFNWMAASRARSLTAAHGAGTRLYTQVVATAQSLAKGPGDVVDVHFIGHSRGTVVIALALEHFTKRTAKSLLGSWVEVTLLDAHPANGNSNALLDYSGPGGLAKVSLVQAFQNLVRDPEVRIPSGANVMRVDVWFQKTLSKDFPVEAAQHSINLWGLGREDHRISVPPFVETHWHDSLTGVNTSFGLIGHSEVHEYYRVFHVDRGLVH